MIKSIAHEARAKNRLQEAIAAQRGFSMNDELATAFANNTKRGLPLTDAQLAEAILKLYRRHVGANKISQACGLPASTLREILQKGKK